ncbi:MAG TPA: helix-turn-helix transcriptional regulator, partial [Treponemataceae bacterium]|nr:helix-turn-helix transcriptional regulator [Treponemataceae bacterium]
KRVRQNTKKNVINRARKRYIPIVRISGKFDQNGNLVSLRWNALDPLPFLKDGILPDRDFFEERGISAREREVIELQLQGYPIKEIANRLYIADSTVKGHLTQVYTKLGISGKGELFKLLMEERVGRLGFSAYAFALLDRLLTIE